MRLSVPGKPPLSPQLVLRLQKTSGNRTVQRLLKRHAMLRAANQAALANRDAARSKWWFLKPFRRGHNGDDGT
ncbi:MAG: hypothetical protein QOH65_685 [Methylobacteriaceae bacterium]|jgi:hypothetical protein|nr:hypothetical protein [Methylobacteriaceae bacterium]